MIGDKPIKWKQLSKEHKTAVLELMIDGLNSRFNELIRAKVHFQFLESLKSGTDFDPAKVWDALEVSTQNHFNHTRKSIDLIESMLDVPELVSTPAKVEPIPKPPVKVKAKKKRGR